MKRTVDLVAIVGITGALLFLASPLWAPTYTYVRKEVANVWGAIQTFPYGITLTSTTQGINTIGIHLRYDADTACWQTWQDGSLGWQLCSGRNIPPDCIAGANPLEFGAMCKNQTTGEVLMKMKNGLVALTGEAR